MKGLSALTSEIGHDGLWSSVAPPPGVHSGRIDIWRVHLEKPAKGGSEIGILAADEIARADRFHFEKDRVHFTRCRLALRFLLTEYIAVPPHEIRFEYRTGG